MSHNPTTRVADKVQPQGKGGGELPRSLPLILMLPTATAPVPVPVPDPGFHVGWAPGFAGVGGVHAFVVRSFVVRYEFGRFFLGAGSPGRRPPVDFRDRGDAD